MHAIHISEYGATRNGSPSRRVAPYIGGRYALADAARAHRDIESRRTSGKLLLMP